MIFISCVSYALISVFLVQICFIVLKKCMKNVIAIILLHIYDIVKGPIGI